MSPDRSLRVLFALMLALSALALCACDKQEEPSGDGAASDPTPALDAALNDLAEKTKAWVAAHDGALPETNVMVYCRGGATVTDPDSLFTKLGFTPPAELKRGNYCFNVDGAKVALAASASEEAEKQRCMVLDFSGDAPSASEITETSSCVP